eukprot:g31147.t1
MPRRALPSHRHAKLATSEPGPKRSFFGLATVIIFFSSGTSPFFVVVPKNCVQWGQDHQSCNKKTKLGALPRFALKPIGAGRSLTTSFHSSQSLGWSSSVGKANAKADTPQKEYSGEFKTDLHGNQKKRKKVRRDMSDVERVPNNNPVNYVPMDNKVVHVEGHCDRCTNPCPGIEDMGPSPFMGESVYVCWDCDWAIFNEGDYQSHFPLYLLCDISSSLCHSDGQLFFSVASCELLACQLIDYLQDGSSAPRNGTSSLSIIAEFPSDSKRRIVPTLFLYTALYTLQQSASITR